MEQLKYALTSEGKKSLEKELRFLIDSKRPEIIEMVKSAREQGDLSENAEYEAARMEQGKVETRIKEIQEILDHAEIIKHTSAKKVRIGSIVTIVDQSDKQEHTYKIVGEIEADPEKDQISNDSPLAKALLDKNEGASVEVRGIERPYKATIVRVA